MQSKDRDRPAPEQEARPAIQASRRFFQELSVAQAPTAAAAALQGPGSARLPGDRWAHSWEGGGGSQAGLGPAGPRYGARRAPPASADARRWYLPQGWRLPCGLVPALRPYTRPDTPPAQTRSRLHAQLQGSPATRTSAARYCSGLVTVQGGGRARRPDCTSGWKSPGNGKRQVCNARD